MKLFGERDLAMFDWPWTPIHFMSGVAVAWVLSQFLNAHSPRFWVSGLALLVLWEIYERTLRRLDARGVRAIVPYRTATRSFGLGPETWANSIGDVLIGAAGMWLLTVSVH